MRPSWLPYYARLDPSEAWYGQDPDIVLNLLAA